MPAMLYELTVQMTPANENHGVDETEIKDVCEALGQAVGCTISKLLEATGGSRSRVNVVKRTYDEEAMAEELADKLAEADENVLDLHVHDVASVTGSTVNNQGRVAQVRFLLQEAGLEETQRIVNEAITGETNDAANVRPARTDPPQTSS